MHSSSKHSNESIHDCIIAKHADISTAEGWNDHAVHKLYATLQPAYRQVKGLTAWHSTPPLAAGPPPPPTLLTVFNHQQEQLEKLHRLLAIEEGSMGMQIARYDIYYTQLQLAEVYESGSKLDERMLRYRFPLYPEKHGGVYHGPNILNMPTLLYRR